MKKVLIAWTAVVTMLVFTAGQAGAAQRDAGGDPFAARPDGAGKPLPAAPAVASGTIENRSGLSASSILRKARRDPAATAASSLERRKRELSMFGKNPARYSATAGAARELPALRQSSTATDVRSNAPAKDSGLRITAKIVAAALCFCLVALLAVLLFHKKSGRKPIIVAMKNEPVDITAYLGSLESFEKQIKWNREQNRKGMK
ncbi:MAG: hypothetical protein ACYS8W_17585 [Planctomycetota bacterium]|jgi:hypothetical protein